MITNTNVGNVTLNGLGATNANFQQDIGEQNMFDPSNIVANDIEGSDPNEWKYWDAFVDYDHMGDLFNLCSVGALFSNTGCPYYNLDNHTQNGYGLDLNPTHVTTYSGSTMITNTNVGNVTLNGLGATNANFQQDIGEQNMFDPSNIVANDIEGSDPNEWKYWDAFVNYDHMGDLFQNPTSPSATLPNEHGSSKDIEGLIFKNNKFPDE
ncbi:hypothetical protein KY289_012109 [Solanum tuberosum]|nr:hypothetical protein KY289_012109 [Solanum tuberosum]